MHLSRRGQARFWGFIFILAMFTCFCGKELANQRGFTRHQAGCEPFKLHRTELSENRRARAATKRRKIETTANLV
jgi:hypothetical protein